MLLLDAFNTFDSVGDNLLSKTELAYALKWLELDLSPADIAELVRHADKDNDGSVPSLYWSIRLIVCLFLVVAH
jgi:Ca2+-binding EF-hand superfamily protein